MNRIYLAIIAALLSFGAIQTIRIEGFFFIKGLRGEVSDLRSELGDLKNAAKVAKQKAEKTYKTLKEEAKDADRNHQAEVVLYRDKLAAYKQSHRVPAQCLRPSGAETPAPPPGGDGPSADSDYIAITRNDFDAFTAIAQRMNEVYKWGQRLIKEGEAVPVEQATEKAPE